MRSVQRAQIRQGAHALEQDHVAAEDDPAAFQVTHRSGMRYHVSHHA